MKNKFSFLFAFQLFCTYLLQGQSTTIVDRDYCQFESFNMSCPPAQSILVERAAYGRMYLGRCISKDYGYIGCSTDVTPLLEKSCSGQRYCQVNVPSLRDIAQPCPRDLTAFLQVSYKCLTVIRNNHLKCNETIHVEGGSTKYLSIASHALQISQDSVPPFQPGCPIVFRTRSGQSIHVKMFTLSEIKTTDAYSNSCSIRAFFAWGDQKGEMDLCVSKGRNSLIANASYLSMHVARGTSKSNWLVEVEAQGCADPIGIERGHWERRGDRLIVKCNLTLETWFLTCSVNSWIGTIANCSNGASQLIDVSSNPLQKPIWLLLAVTVGVILGVLVGSSMLISFFLYRKRIKSEATEVSQKQSLAAELHGCQLHPLTHRFATYISHVVPPPPPSPYSLKDDIAESNIGGVYGREARAYSALDGRGKMGFRCSEGSQDSVGGLVHQDLSFAVEDYHLNDAKIRYGHTCQAKYFLDDDSFRPKKQNLCSPGTNFPSSHLETLNRHQTSFNSTLVDGKR